MFWTLGSSIDVDIGTLHKLHKHSTVKKTVTISLDNYFKRQATSENKTRVQIEAAQANLTNIDETELHERYKTRAKNNNYQPKIKLGKKPNTFSNDNEVKVRPYILG